MTVFFLVLILNIQLSAGNQTAFDGIWRVSMATTGSTAAFVRCAELRQRAGMSLDELIQKVGPRPARSSYERLERGLAIRANSAFKIANAVNAELKRLGLEPFFVDDEVKYK